MSSSLLFLLMLLLGVGSVVLLIYGISQRKKVHQIIGGLLLLVSGFIGIELAQRAFSKAYETTKDLGEVAKKRAKEKLEGISLGREGMEIYTGFFGEPVDSCVKVLNSRDAVVPQMDESIILHFRCCGDEVRRILQDKKVDKDSVIAAEDFWGPYGYQDWFKPQRLGDSIVEIQIDTASSSINSRTSMNSRTLYLSRDSTEAFYSYIFP